MIRRVFFRAAVLAVCLALAPLGALAQTQFVALETSDQGRAFNAVGRIDLNGRGFCTGTLIAPDLVLTAAHCLFDRDSGARLPLAGLSFAPAFRNGRAAAFSAVRRAAVHDRYDMQADDPVLRVANDLALLELSQPIYQTSVVPLQIQPNLRGAREVALVSYAHDRAEVPSLEPECAVLAEENLTQVLSCDVDFGSSGAPVILFGRDGVQVLSVVSAKARWQGRKVALAALVDDRIAYLRARLTTDPVAPALPQVRRIGTGTATTQAGGAKFLRP